MTKPEDIHRWAASEAKRGAFAEVVLAGDAIGVPVLPVKGVLTAQLFYPDPADRVMVDIDVRARPRNIGAPLRRRGGARLGAHRAFVCVRVRGVQSA